MRSTQLERAYHRVQGVSDTNELIELLKLTDGGVDAVVALDCTRERA